MTIRMMANGIPGFQADGFRVGSSWAAIDVADLAPAARDALIKYSGRFVRVHPDDVSQLAAHNLELYTDEASGLQRLRALALEPRALEPGEKLEAGTTPPGVTVVPISAPTPEPPAPAPAAPTPAGRGGRSSR